MSEETRDEQTLIEEVAGAFRHATPHQIAYLPAFRDLSAEGREEAFDLSLRMRALEAALDPRGYSATVHAVLDKLSR